MLRGEREGCLLRLAMALESLELRRSGLGGDVREARERRGLLDKGVYSPRNGFILRDVRRPVREIRWQHFITESHIRVAGLPGQRHGSFLDFMHSVLVWIEGWKA